MISAETQLTLAMLRRQPRPGSVATGSTVKRPTGGRRNPAAAVVLPEDRWIDSKLWHRKPAKQSRKA